MPYSGIGTGAGGVAALGFGASADNTTLLVAAIVMIGASVVMFARRLRRNGSHQKQ